MWWRKWHKENLVGKWFPIFNEKNTPDRLSLSRSVMEQADMYEVYIRDGGNVRGYLFDRMEGNELIVKQYDAEDDGYSESVRLPIGDVSPENVNGLHFYRGYRIGFDGLAQLESRGLRKLLADIDNDQKKDKSQQDSYNSQLPRINDRMKVLEVAIGLYVQRGHPFGISRIATQIYTHRWEDHPQREIIERELQLALDSFIAGGEFSLEHPQGYLPTGKAFTTLAEYELQNRRHMDNTSLQKKLLWATVFAAVAAACSAIAAFLPLFIHK